MVWHIVCRIGETDRFVPPIDDAEPRLLVPIDQPGNPKEVVHSLLRPFIQDVGLQPPPTAQDLLNLAIAVYAADLRAPRKCSKDGWMREFVLHLPVRDVARWEGASSKLARMLQFLTGDQWELRLRSRLTTKSTALRQRLVVAKPDIVSLFSGGLDSFVGALDRLDEGRRLVLVGHYGSGVTHPPQTELSSLLNGAYKDASTAHFFHVQPPRQGDDAGETTMRSRSILFLGLGTCVASAYGPAVPLQVAENGFISLNVPLTNTRMGSFSTRTTHPHFINLFRTSLTALGIRTPIELPYRFHTKGEMLTGARNQKLLRVAVPQTMSCSHPEAGRFRGLSPNLPCGHCLPCIIRQASVAATDIEDRPHAIDIRSAGPAAASQSGSDLRAVQMAVERLAKETPIARRLRILQSGPIPAQEFGQYADVFTRGLAEVRRFLKPAKVRR